MFDLLRAHVLKRIELTDEEFSQSTTFFIPKKIRKHQFLLQEGEVCKSLAFVVKGCLRAKPCGANTIAQSLTKTT
jgi:hypothetical protein